MKLLVVLSAVVVLASCRPQNNVPEFMKFVETLYNAYIKEHHKSKDDTTHHSIPTDFFAGPPTQHQTGGIDLSKNPFFQNTPKHHQAKTVIPHHIQKSITPVQQVVIPNNQYVTAPVNTQHPVNPQDEALFKEQARSAHYAFATKIDDTINDHSHQRMEVREGTKLRGSYSYSDGFFKRTVNYEADEKGYRVTGESVEPIGTGPQFHPEGRAIVATHVAGKGVQYEITTDDYNLENTTDQDFIPAF